MTDRRVSHATPNRILAVARQLVIPHDVLIGCGADVVENLSQADGVQVIRCTR